MRHVAGAVIAGLSGDPREEDGHEAAGQGRLCGGQLRLRVHHGGGEGGVDEGRGGLAPPLQNQQ